MRRRIGIKITKKNCNLLILCSIGPIAIAFSNSLLQVFLCVHLDDDDIM